MKQKSLCLLICLFLSLGLFAQIEFVNFDLNNHNNLLFSVEHTPIVESDYEALFFMSLDKEISQSAINMKDSNPRLLTCYPEKIEILQNANIYQFRNRYGTAQYNVKEKSLTWVKRAKEIESIYYRSRKGKPFNFSKLATKAE